MRKIRKEIILILAVLIVAGGVPWGVYAEDNPFTDLSPSHPHYEAIMYCYENKIFSGITDTTFAPDKELTRAMFVTLLGRTFEASGQTISESELARFTDVEQSSWYSDYVAWAARKTIVSGTSETTFDPNQSVTREQAAAIAMRFSDVTHLQLKNNLTRTFSDEDQVSSWFTSEMNKAISSGLAIGYNDGALLPLKAATRGETAELLYKLKTEYMGSDLKLIEISNTYVPIKDGLSVNKFDPNAFTTTNGYKQYDDGSLTATMGIDVSAYQGEINWRDVKNAGVEFAFIRVGGRGYGEAGTVFSDEFFEKNVQGALDNDIEVGVYFFSQAINTTEAKEEAEFVIDKLKGLDITYPVVFDWETIPGVNARTDNTETTVLTDSAIAFCEAIASEGYEPMVYVNKSTALLKYDLSRLQKYDIWLSEYNDLPGFYYDFQIWQYTQTGKVNGINGDVDINLCFTNY